MFYVKYKKLIIVSLLILNVNLYGSNYTVLADATAKLIMDMKILKNDLNKDLNQSIKEMNLYIKNIDTNQTNNLNHLKNKLFNIIKHSNSRYRLKIDTLQKELTNKINYNFAENNRSIHEKHIVLSKKIVDIQNVANDNKSSLEHINTSLEDITKRSKLLKKVVGVTLSKIATIETNLTTMHKNENQVEANRLKIQAIEELLQKKNKTDTHTKAELKRLKVLDERFDRLVK